MKFSGTISTKCLITDYGRCLGISLGISGSLIFVKKDDDK